GDGIGGPDKLINPFLQLYRPDGGLIGIDGDSAADGRNAHLRMTLPVAGKYFVHVGSSSGSGEYLLRATTFGDPKVIARQIFYNNSAFDGTAGPSVSDDLAIATDKTPLLPGGTATFSNYTSFSRGINGIMIDVASLPVESLTATDFIFKVGTDNDPTTWADAPAPSSITVRGGEGIGGSD